MAEILSQLEIDTLLASVSSTEVAPEGLKPKAEPTEAEKLKKKASLYNFARPDRVSKEQLRSLHFLHDRFARNFSSSLSALLRTITEINLISVDQLSYSEFLMSLPDPTCFNVLSVFPLEGNAALEINPTIVFPIIDRLLGGSGKPISRTRGITDIEQKIMDSVILLVLEDLQEAWSQVIDLTLKIEAREISPQLIQIIAPNEIVILVVFDVLVGEASGMMNICFPTLVLEPIFNKFNQEWFTGAKKDIGSTSERHLRKLIQDMNLTISAELGKAFLTVRDLLNLEKGDIITLDTKIDQPVPVVVQRKYKFKGYPGTVGSNKAIMIEEILKSKKEDSPSSQPLSEKY